MASVCDNTFKSLKWMSCPIVDESVVKSIILIVAILLASVLTSFSLGVWYGVLAFILLFLSLAKYFIPTTYELSPEGVSVTFGLFSKKKGWSYYTRYAVRHDGIFLSPFRSPSKMDSFRGDFLKFGRTVNFRGVRDALNGVFGV